MAAARPSLPPGPPYPALLSSLGWFRRTEPFLRRCRERYGDVFTLKIIPEGTWVLLGHPDAVKQVFTGDPRLLHAGEANQILMPIVGRHSVLLLDDDAHLQHRRMLLPPFHGQRMQRYLDTMTEVAEHEVAQWPRGTQMELFSRMQAVTLEIILRTVFGVHDAARLERLRKLIVELLSVGEDLRAMLVLAVLGPKRLARFGPWIRERAPLDELLLEEIRLRRAAPDLDERDDVLSMLVQARHEDGTPMADDELRDELLTLLVAGHETTATALSWAFERLVRDPARLERLASGDDAYADAVVKETLRLRPVIPVVVRRLVEPMEIGGHLLPAGIAVAPSVHLIHQREDIYPEPRRFRPERFLEQPAGTYTWIPFGGGVRRCLGASFALFEMKVVLQTVARRLWLEPADPAPEGIKRRLIVLTPDRNAEVVATSAAPSAGSASR